MSALLLCAADADDPQLDRYAAAAERRGLVSVVVRDAVAARTEATVRGVIAVRRADAVLAADLARALGVPWHDPEAVRLSVNRLHMLGRLTAAGLPVPRFTSLDVATGDGLERLAGVPGPWRVTAADPRHDTPAAASAGTLAAEPPPALRVLEDAHALEAYVAARRPADDGADGEGGVLVVEPVLATAGWLVVGLIDAGALRVVTIVDTDDVGPQRGRCLQVPTALARDAQAHLGGLVAIACASLGLRQGPVVAMAGAMEGGACLVDVWPGTLEVPASDLLQVVGPSMEPVSLEDLVLRQAVGDALDGYALDGRERTIRLET